MSAVAPPAEPATRPDEDPELTGSSETTKPRRSAAELIDSLGVIIAPVIISGLAGLLYLYYLNLDINNQRTQVRSALGFSDKLIPQTQRHLELAFLSTALVLVIAIPLGIALTRPAFRRVAPAIIAVANSGQALPAYGLLAIFLTFFGLGKLSVVYALALYALLPVLRNTMVGLAGVDKSVIEAGRGMGMTRLGVLARIELPLSVPIIMAGVRTAVILNIGMATLAFTIGGGGLGITISSGLKNSAEPVLIIGSSVVILIALSFDWLGAVAERILRPRGL